VFLELTRNIHGRYSLPLGYTFTRVPADASLNFLDSGAPDPVSPTKDIAYSWSFIKALVSVLQLLYATSSLYRTRGNQIDIYGFAAFGLTVAPHAVMSFVNLLGNVVAVEFPMLYMVDSPIMQEAVKRGGRFASVVATLCATEGPKGSGFVNGHLERDHDETAAFVVEREAQRGLEDQDAYAAAPEANDTESNATDDSPTGDVLEPRPGILAVPTCLPFATLTDPGQQRAPSIQRSCISHISRPADWRLTPEGIPLDSCNKRQVERAERLLYTAPSTKGEFLRFVAYYLPAAASLSIVGGLSRWHNGTSTLAQRVWTMMWLALGCGLNMDIFRVMYEELETLGEENRLPFSGMRFADNDRLHRAGRWILRRLLNDEANFERKVRRVDIGYKLCEVLLLVTYSAPAIGGLVVVGQMLSDYGACFKVF
jgi:hypothetical protein